MLYKKLTVILNDDMVKFASEKGYKVPCVSISHYYGNKGVFDIYFKDNKPDRYELNIYNQNDDCISIWKYNSKITTAGPVEVEHKYKRGYVHPMEKKKKTLGELAKAARKETKLNKAKI
jgi:hypothetical protein